MSANQLKAAATGQAIETSSVKSFSNFLDKYKAQISLALPKHLNADRMARLALTEFSKNPKLQECEPTSIIGSIMTASTLGLEIGVNGQCYMVPYKQNKKVGNKWTSTMICQCIPGWKGLVDLVNRGGKGTVFTGVIFSDQKYTFTDGARRDLVIHNETDLEDADDITHAYAIGWVKGADIPIIELWRVSKITKHREKYNKVGESHYSFKDFEMYARKIPLLQVLKYMPQSIEMQKAVEISEAQETGNRATIEGDFVTVQPIDNNDPHGNVDPETGEIGNTQGEPDALTYAQVAEKINRSDGLDVLDLAADLISSITDEAQQAELTALYKSRKEALTK